MFKYSVATIVALTFMGTGCVVSPKTFRPRGVEVFASGGESKYKENTTGKGEAREKHHHTRKSVFQSALNGNADIWNVGGSVRWDIIYKDEEAARERRTNSTD